MKKILVYLILSAVGCLLCGGIQSVTAARKTTFVTIGTGGITGVYYPTGGAIASIINQKRKVYGIRCTVESTSGSVFNINAVMAGDLEFGIVQSDRQYQAYKGLKEWEETGPKKDLRAVFSIYPESLTLCAAVDSGIRSIHDLKGKTVNIGNPGSGQFGNSVDALEAFGISYINDLKAEQYRAAESPGLLQDGRLDAFFYTVGHPAGALKEAVTGSRKVMFIPISGNEINRLIRRYPYYAKSYIPVDLYPGVENTENIDTFGVKATLVTSAKISDQVVYAITKEVLENFDYFKSLHPAYKVLTREGMLEGLSAPLHPGAVQYYREAGLMK